jgi:hypothetical protein
LAFAEPPPTLAVASQMHYKGTKKSGDMQGFSKFVSVLFQMLKLAASQNRYCTIVPFGFFNVEEGRRKM